MQKPAIPNYGMFSKRGNAVIHGIVQSALLADLEQDLVLHILRDISTQPGLEEATDTAVREAVLYSVYGD